MPRLTDGLTASEVELKSAREQAKRKTRSIHRLRRERDGCISELETEREQLRISLENLAKAEENSPKPNPKHLRKPCLQPPAPCLFQKGSVDPLGHPILLRSLSHREVPFDATLLTKI